jgi:hypothetical protein
MTTNSINHNCQTCGFFKFGEKEDLSILGSCLSPDDISSFEIDDIESECKHWVCKIGMEEE